MHLQSSLAINNPITNRNNYGTYNSYSAENGKPYYKPGNGYNGNNNECSDVIHRFGGVCKDYYTILKNNVKY